MLKFIKNGNIFDSDAYALVNPVNCIGPMGAGLAKQFADKFKGLQAEFWEECEAGRVWPGRLVPIYSEGKIIINFPTKGHWKDPSEYEYIRRGLITLYEYLHQVDRDDEPQAGKVAIPKLGCGLGGLDWAIVRKMIENELKNSFVEIEVYE